MATDKPRFSVTFTEDSFKKIKEYQREHNISTQSKAVAQLVEIAMSRIASQDSKQSPSTAEATPGEVFTSIEKQFGVDAKKAFSTYVQLDERDQGQIYGEMKQMLTAEKYKTSPVTKGENAKAV